MRSLGYAAALLLLVSASGCDRINQFAGGPSLTSLPAHLPPYKPPGRAIAVCYNKDTAKMADLRKAAFEACTEPGSKLEYLTGDEYLNDCPLLKKRRAIFVCREPAGLPKIKRPRSKRHTDSYFPPSPYQQYQ